MPRHPDDPLDVIENGKPLRPFVIEGWFEARDIDDAFAWLANHFAALASDTEEVDAERRRELTVKPAGLS